MPNISIMKRIKIIYLILTAVILSCEERPNPHTFNSEDAENLKLEFLINALLEKTKPQILSSKKVLISNFYKFPSLDNQIWIEGEWKKVSRIDYLSYHLNEKDTSFLREQINQENDLIAHLSKHGFQVLNSQELLEEGISLDSIDKIAEERSRQNKTPGERDYIMIDKPVFSKDLNRLYLKIAGHNYGYEYVFTKSNDTIEKYDIAYWVE